MHSQKPAELKKVPKREEESARIQEILRENMSVACGVTAMRPSPTNGPYETIDADDVCASLHVSNTL